MMADEIAPAFDPAGEGYGFSADTVEDLAGKLGMAPSELVTTVNQWNDACDAGNDPYFHRPADTLTPIKHVQRRRQPGRMLRIRTYFSAQLPWNRVGGSAKACRSGLQPDHSKAKSV